MAASVLRSLIVDIRTRSAKFERGMKQAARQTTSFRTIVTKTGGALLKFQTAISGVAGIGLLALTKKAIAAGDQINKLSTRLGASTEALSQYQFVAERTGVQFTTLTTGIQRATRRIAEAAIGTGEAKGALAELGLEVQSLSRLRPEQQFEAIADAMQGVEKDSDKVRLAMKLFDTEGVALLQTMEGGSAAIRELRKEADALGLTLDKATADKMSEAKDATTRLTSAMQGLGNQLAVEFADDITTFVTKLKDGTAELKLFLSFVNVLNTDQGRLADIAGDLTNLRTRRDILLSQVEALKASGQEAADLKTRTIELLEVQKQILALQKERAAIGESSAAAEAGRAPPISITEGQRVPIGLPNLNVIEEQERAKHQLIFEILQEEQARILAERQKHLDMWIEPEAEATRKYAEQAAERIRIEETASEMIITARMAALSQGVALLQAFAGKSKSAAIAAIALHKGLAIANTIMSTKAAAMRALEELGPIAGPPVAGQITALGAASVAAIAATGLAQAASVGSGGISGAGGGSGANPGEPSNPITVNPESTSQSSVTIHITGNVLSRQFVLDDVIPEIRDAVNNRDVVVIDAGTRQQAELVA